MAHKILPDRIFSHDTKVENRSKQRGLFFDALSVKKDLGFPLEPLVLFSL